METLIHPESKGLSRGAYGPMSRSATPFRLRGRSRPERHLPGQPPAEVRRSPRQRQWPIGSQPYVRVGRPRSGRQCRRSRSVSCRSGPGEGGAVRWMPSPGRGATSLNSNPALPGLRSRHLGGWRASWFRNNGLPLLSSYSHISWARPGVGRVERLRLCGARRARGRRKDFRPFDLGRCPLLGDKSPR